MGQFSSDPVPPDFWPTAFHWQHCLAVINAPDIQFMLFCWNSLKIALIVTAVQQVTCSMAGYAFGRLRFRGRDFLCGLFRASLMIPATMTLVLSCSVIRERGLVDTHGHSSCPA